MLAWLKTFFFDETAFVGFVRAVALGLGTAQTTGQLDDLVNLPSWVGVVMIMVGGFFRSSSKSAKLPANGAGS